MQAKNRDWANTLMWSSLAVVAGLPLAMVVGSQSDPGNAEAYPRALAAAERHAEAEADERPVVGEEQGGFLVVEAERYTGVSKDGVRNWTLTRRDAAPDIQPDPDPSHAESASGGAYLEILPDTRVTHDDPLVHGESFSNAPGQVAIVSYKVRINTPGRYYVWACAHSTGSEDNGVHVGLNGEWPASGQRMQWCDGKRSWYWESKQRTKEVHCGVPHEIYLDIEQAGEHTISFSMREDGFELDRWLITTERDYNPREDDELDGGVGQQ